MVFLAQTHLLNYVAHVTISKFSTVKLMKIGHFAKCQVDKNLHKMLSGATIYKPTVISRWIQYWHLINYDFMQHLVRVCMLEAFSTCGEHVWVIYVCTKYPHINVPRLVPIVQLISWSTLWLRVRTFLRCIFKQSTNSKDATAATNIYYIIYYHTVLN